MVKKVFYIFIITYLKIVLCENNSYEFTFMQTPKNGTFESHYKLDFESLTELFVGTPGQSVNFTFNPSISFINIASVNESYHVPCIFNVNKSFTFKRASMDNIYLFSLDYHQELKVYNDKCRIGETKCFCNLFVWFKDGKSNYGKTEIGLLKSSQGLPYLSFAEQLYAQNLLNELKITIIFLKNNRGKIFFGMNNIIEERFKNTSYIKIPFDDLVNEVNDKEMQKTPIALPNPSTSSTLTNRKNLLTPSLPLIPLIEQKTHNSNSSLKTPTNPYIPKTPTTPHRPLNPKTPTSPDTPTKSYTPKGPLTPLVSFDKNIPSLTQKKANKYKFDPSSGFIQIPKAYHKAILSSMFSDIHRSCLEEMTNEIHNYYNKGSFTSFIIHRNNYTWIEIIQEFSINYDDTIMTLKNKDTFKEFNQTHMILVITFIDNDNPKTPWIIGEPILKQYIIHYDLTNDQMRLYSNEESELWSYLVYPFGFLCIFGIIASVFLLVKGVINCIRTNMPHIQSDIVEKVQTDKLMNS